MPKIIMDFEKTNWDILRIIMICAGFSVLFLKNELLIMGFILMGFTYYMIIDWLFWRLKTKRELDKIDKYYAKNNT